MYVYEVLWTNSFHRCLCLFCHSVTVTLISMLTPHCQNYLLPTRFQVDGISITNTSDTCPWYNQLFLSVCNCIQSDSNASPKPSGKTDMGASKDNKELEEALQEARNLRQQLNTVRSENAQLKVGDTKINISDCVVLYTIFI